MRKQTKLFGVVVAAALCFGCAAQATSESKSTGNPIADAEAALKRAAAVGYEWRDSGKTLAKAKDAAASGDQAKAASLANRVKFEAEQAVSQAKRQGNDWQARVPR